MRGRLDMLITETNTDEMMAVGQIFDHQARLRSFEIAAEVFQQINAARGGERAAGVTAS